MIYVLLIEDFGDWATPMNSTAGLYLSSPHFSNSTLSNSLLFFSCVHTLSLLTLLSTMSGVALTHTRFISKACPCLSSTHTSNTASENSTSLPSPQIRFNNSNFGFRKPRMRSSCNLRQ